MTEFVSKENLAKMAAKADAEAAKSQSKVRKFGAWALGLTAAAVGAALWLPAVPAVVAATLIGAGALYATAGAAGHYAAKKELEAVKRETDEEGFAEKLRARVAKTQRFSKHADKLNNIGLWSYVGTTFAAILFPPIAPVMTALRVAASVMWFGGGALKMATGTPERVMREMQYDLRPMTPKETLREILSPTSGLSNSPSPANDFGMATTAKVEADSPRKRSVFAPKP